MFKFIKRIFRPAIVLPTALESAVLEFEEAQRRQLYYKKAQEDNKGSAVVVEARIRRLNVDIARMTEEPILGIEVRAEVRKRDERERGVATRTPLQIARHEIEESEKELLTMHREAEDAAGQVDILTKRISRLRSTISRLAAEKKANEVVEEAAHTRDVVPSSFTPAMRSPLGQVATA